MPRAEHTTKWISIDVSTSSQLFGTYGGLATSTRGLYRTDRERKEAQEILVRDWPLLIAKVIEKTVPTMEGQEMYHYAYTLDKNKLRAFFTDAFALSSKKSQTPEVYSKLFTESAINMFASSSGELFIGKDDFYPHRVTFHTPISIATSSVLVAGTIDLDMHIFDFNKVKEITAPNDATPYDQVIQAIEKQSLSTSLASKEKGATVASSLAASPMQSRDAKRVADLRQIQLAEEHYFDAHGKYSPTLNVLVQEKLITMIPSDPLPLAGGKKIDNYVYKQLKQGASYQLGASLEDASNTALSVDEDSKTFGNDRYGCRGERLRYCYNPGP